MSDGAGPSAAAQVAFLGKIERLLGEGQFVATYKYALLIALADLAVQHGGDDGAPLDLPVRTIAERFIELYWRQCAPYGGAVADGEYGILLQNTGRQASIIGVVASLRRTYGTLSRAASSPEWRRAVSETARLIQTMPLWRLQVLRSETLDFLYEKSPKRGHIRLKDGVAANLRRFHGMIVRLAQAEWLHFIQSLPANAGVLGPISDLGQFLFGAERAALMKVAGPLAEAQSGLCLYCQRAVHAGEVDHFVPWSRYPRDLAHNLVLAHAKCNRDKSDLLAAEIHLERWMRRNEDHGQAIGEAGTRSNLIVDLPATIGVARWAYAHGQSLQARTWLHGDALEALSGRWSALLGT
ncbi:MAG: HNH endonuclease [Gammaproteobacteria bacterium]|nr:HNH endonuclease [Gammaproteobacteria bacterium]